MKPEPPPLPPPPLTRRRFLYGTAALTVAGTFPRFTVAAQGSADSLLIRGAVVVNADDQGRADLRLCGGKVAEMAPELEPHAGEEVYDAAGLLVLPGGIDPHCHFSAPFADNYESGSKAALAGGVTTVGSIAFPNPGESLVAVYERHARLIRDQAMADVLLHPVLADPGAENLAQIDELRSRGSTSLKIFMATPAFDSRARDFIRALTQIREAGLLAMMHCEDYPLIAERTAAMEAKGRSSLRHYADSRPVVSEVVATQRAVALCEATGAPIYVVHLSSRRALAACREARQRGLPVWVETRPLYLHFTAERFQEADGALYVGQPPLREAADREALWQGLEQGTVHTVATDHAPWTREQKLHPELTISNFRPGVANLQEMLPMLYSEGVHRGRLSLQRFVAVTSTNAARLFGLYPRKGVIRPGADADLVLWDPGEIRTIDEKDLFSRAGFSPYHGHKVTGWPRLTVKGGAVVWRDGEILASPGSGRLLRRGPTQPV